MLERKNQPDEYMLVVIDRGGRRRGHREGRDQGGRRLHRHLHSARRFQHQGHQGRPHHSLLHRALGRHRGESVERQGVRHAQPGHPAAQELAGSGRRLQDPLLPDRRAGSGRPHRPHLSLDHVHDQRREAAHAAARHHEDVAALARRFRAVLAGDARHLHPSRALAVAERQEHLARGRAQGLRLDLGRVHSAACDPLPRKRSTPSTTICSISSVRRAWTSR